MSKESEVRRTITEINPQTLNTRRDKKWTYLAQNNRINQNKISAGLWLKYS